MRTRLFLSLVFVLCACGEDGSSSTPAAAAANEPVVAARPGEDAILARWDAAQAEITRLEAERERPEEASPDADRRVRLRRAIELRHESTLAALRRDEAEVDFLALACPETASTIAERARAATTEERTARERWLPARLASVDADVALTQRIEDDDAEDAAIERATEAAETARATWEEIEEVVREAADRRVDLQREAREACAEPLPGARAASPE